MNTFQYQVVAIDGDYAHLKRIDEESEELKLVALAAAGDHGGYQAPL